MELKTFRNSEVFLIGKVLKVCSEYFGFFVFLLGSSWSLGYLSNLGLAISLEPWRCSCLMYPMAAQWLLGGWRGNRWLLKFQHPWWDHHPTSSYIQGCCWSHGQLPLPDDVQDYAVYLIGDALFLHFPGHLGGASKADIALDDIKFLSSNCDCKLHHINHSFCNSILSYSKRSSPQTWHNAHNGPSYR